MKKCYLFVILLSLLVLAFSATAVFADEVNVEVEEEMLVLTQVDGVPASMAVTLSLFGKNIAVVEGDSIIFAEPFPAVNKADIKIDLQGTGRLVGAKFKFEPVVEPIVEEKVVEPVIEEKPAIEEPAEQGAPGGAGAVGETVAEEPVGDIDDEGVERDVGEGEGVIEPAEPAEEPVEPEDDMAEPVTEEDNEDITEPAEVDEGDVTESEADTTEGDNDVTEGEGVTEDEGDAVDDSGDVDVGDVTEAEGDDAAENNSSEDADTNADDTGSDIE